MKKLNFMLLILAVSIAGCVQVDCNNNCNGAISSDNFDLTHYFEPHVTVMHEVNHDGEESHFYSVMLVVEKDVEVFIDKKNTGDGVYDVKYYFAEAKGTEPAKAIKTYPLNANYELRMYKYAIEYVGMEKLQKSSESGSKDETTKFEATVVVVPPGHPHDDPKPLHKGVIHRPGLGGGGD